MSVSTEGEAEESAWPANVRALIFVGVGIWGGGSTVELWEIQNHLKNDYGALLSDEVKANIVTKKSYVSSPKVFIYMDKGRASNFIPFYVSQVFDDITLGRTLCDDSGRLTLEGFKSVFVSLHCWFA